jgi:hypothetical protein
MHHVNNITVCCFLKWKSIRIFVIHLHSSLGTYYRKMTAMLEHTAQPPLSTAFPVLPLQGD